MTDPLQKAETPMTHEELATLRKAGQELDAEHLLRWLDGEHHLCIGETHRDCDDCAFVRTSLRAVLTRLVHIDSERDEDL